VSGASQGLVVVHCPSPDWWLGSPSLRFTRLLTVLDLDGVQQQGVGLASMLRVDEQINVAH
jgi:hypothetical protein